MRFLVSALLLSLSAAPVLADDFKALPEGPGRDVMVRVCAQCHSPEIVATQSLDPDGWKALVDQMAARWAATDGDLGTRWSSAFSDPQWLEVDLGATHTINKVVLDWETAYATAFQIQTSNDGSTWTTIYSTTAGTGGDQTLTVSGSGRYVRMYGTARATQYGYSLWEFQVYGS